MITYFTQYCNSDSLEWPLIHRWPQNGFYGGAQLLNWQVGYEDKQTHLQR